MRHDYVLVSLENQRKVVNNTKSQKVFHVKMKYQYKNISFVMIFVNAK